MDTRKRKILLIKQKKILFVIIAPNNDQNI